MRDYPRGCGDTAFRFMAFRQAEGLSPRVRGHLYAIVFVDSQHGTIPAGAGTPRHHRAAASRLRDYPRGCGDTKTTRRMAHLLLGLSPRVRGHLKELHDFFTIRGTIPAGAGTPAQRRSGRSDQEDYPRGCGDTKGQLENAHPIGGLSPRVRGHHQRTTRIARLQGTIPAGAGTPSAPWERFASERDYPRGCGDTSAWTS